mgnify:CR=1 FL=1
MRRIGTPRLAWLLALLLSWSPVATTLAAPREEPAASAPAERATVEVDAAMERGLEKERRKDWSGAIEVYRGAMEKWPGRTDFRRRLRLCELHFKLGKRYHDASFRTVLLRLPREQSTELYSEVLERIQSFYVEAVGLEPLLRHGLDNLEVALRDPTFLKLNATTTEPERIAWLREQYKAMRGRLAVADREAALALALQAADLARHGLGIEATPILLEFTYGACDALDDFTSYLTPDKLEDLYAMIDGNFVGLGVELKGATEGLKLVGVIRGGPAWEAGLVAGDQIVKIAGQPVKGLALDEAANRLQGTEGTSVDLEVLKRDATVAVVRLIRRHVDVESVTRAKIVDEGRGIGYVQLAGFQKSSTDELDQAISGLVNLGMKTLVLDLRGNPGGLLNVAVDIADRFIDSGVIVSTRGRATGQSQVFQAGGRARWRMPMYVLTDRDSASASEILAGALQDHKRAVIVGDRTYGKGSVQSIFSLRSAPAGLKLTTAKFYSPTDRAYSERGVTPDMPVKVHVAARPVDGAEPEGLDETQLGDPRTDPVLAAAIRASDEGARAQASAR